MYYTYIIASEKTGRYYVGYTGDLDKRLARHNAGWSRSTKSGIPWKIVYYEIYENKTDAIKREQELKRWKSRERLEALIQG
ncbi:MAG: GIY-YIG nuclease family protein [Fidelibacterota bacterium]